MTDGPISIAQRELFDELNGWLLRVKYKPGFFLAMHWYRPMAREGYVELAWVFEACNFTDVTSIDSLRSMEGREEFVRSGFLRLEAFISERALEFPRQLAVVS